MSLSSAFTVALSGMNAATTALQVSANNVANAQTTGALPDASGKSTVYHAQQVVQTAVPGGGVATKVVEKSPAWETSVRPQDPWAGPDGRVAAPNVDYTSEVADQLTARIAYQASLKVMKVADEMMKATTDISL